MSTSTRIRYKKTSDDNVVQSVKTFQHPSNGARYKVRINTQELEYFVIEDTADVLVSQGRAVNLHQVKMKSKKALEELGIPFTEEDRTRLSKTNP